MEHQNDSGKKYIKICKDSGCVSASYNITDDKEGEITLIPSESGEISGRFREIKNKQELHANGQESHLNLPHGDS